MTKQRRIVGTAGHIDHGKTTLVRALTGVDCDRLPEEKRRGITIDLGFANWSTGELQIGFVDVPGHERFVKNMLAGVGGIDAALLVVAADESIKPQTREHFAICSLLRIPTGVVAITKSDLVDDDIIEIVRLEIEDLVRGSFLEKRPIVAVSSTTGEGIDELKAAMLEVLASSSERDITDHVFRLPIDRVFSLKGYGTVITGTAVSGTLKSDSEIEILPAGLRSRARTVQVHGESRPFAFAGERTSLNVADLETEQISRGEQAVEPGSLRSSSIITASLELLPDAPPLKDGARVRFHHFAAELLGSVRIIASGAEAIAPGTNAYVQIRLESPVVAVAGDRYVIRRYSPSTTIGGGVVLDPLLPKLARGSRREFLDTLASATLEERAQVAARIAGINGITLEDLRARTGISLGVLTAAAAKFSSDTLLSVGSGRFIHRELLVDLRRRAMDFLRNYFRDNRVAVGVPKSEFVQKILPNADPSVVQTLLDDLVNEKIIVTTGDLVDVPGRSKSLGGVEGELARIIESRFLEGGLKPPPVSELIQTIQQKNKVIEGVVGYLVKTKVLVRIAEGVYLHASAVGETAAKMKEHSGKTVDIAWFKEYFGLSRKIAVPLLEHLDRIGVTRRSGDSRLVL